MKTKRLKRRKFLKTATGAIGVTSLAGCLNPVTGPIHIRGGLPMIPVPPWEEQKDEPVRMKLESVNRVRATETVEQFGLSKRVDADVHGVTYSIQVDPHGIDVPTSDGSTLRSDLNADRLDGVDSSELALFSVPRFEVAGKTFSPIDDLQPRDVLEDIQGGTDTNLRNQGDVRISFQPSVVVGDGTVDGFDPAKILKGAYNGQIDSMNIAESGTDFTFRGEAKGSNMAAFVAPLNDSDSFGIIGGIERIEVDGGDIIKVGWVPVSDDFARTARTLDYTGRLVAQLSSTPVTTGSITYDGTNYVRPDWCHTDASNLSNIVDQCIDGCDTDDCMARCLTKFANWDHEMMKEYVDCNIHMAYMKLAIDGDPPIGEVVSDVYSPGKSPKKG